MRNAAIRRRSEEPNPNQELGYEEIDYDDEHAGDHHGLGRGAADAFGSPGRVQSLVTAHQGNDEGEEERFDQPLRHIVVGQRLIGRMSSTLP